MKALFYTIAMFLFAFSTKAQWNSNTDINLDIADLAVADLQTAHTSDGKTWIAFYQPNSSGNYDMRAQLLDASGNKLLGANGLLVGNQTSGTATFVFNACVDANDNLIIGYQYEIAGNMTAVVTKVTPQGALPWGNGIVLGEGLAPYPASNSAGDIIVSWINNSPSTCYIQKVSSAGNVMWTSPVSVTVGASNTTRGQIVTHPNGDFTLVFQKKGVAIYTTLYAQRYNSDGVAIWSAPLQLSNLTTAGVRYYSVISDNNTVYVGYYASVGSRFSGYVQKITAAGTIPWGMNGSAVSTYASGAEPMQQTTNIAHDPASGFVWSVSTYCDVNQTEYGVYVQKFDTATGAVQLAPEGKEVYPISTSFDTQAGDLLLINDAPLFMSYDASYKIYATLLNSTGDFVWPGNRVVLSSTTASLATPKGRYAFSGVVNNQAVAVWQENRGGEDRAYAQNVNQQTYNLIQDFESGASSATDCWTAYNQSSTPTTNAFFASTTIVHAGNTSGGLYSCCGGTATNTSSYYISPALSSGSHTVDFFVRQSSFFGEDFEIGTVSDNQGSNFTLLHTISSWPSTPAWQPVNISITTDATNNRIAFRVPPSSLKTYYLDDIVLGDVGNLGPTACNYVPATPTITVTVSANGSTNICAGGSVQLNASVSVTGSYQYEWYYNAVLVPGANTSFYSASMPGSYYCKVTDGSSNVYASNTITVTNNPPATPIASANGPICSGSTLNLSASTTSPGTATWSWTGPGGFVSTLQNPVISNATVSASGTYAVTVTIDGCISAVSTTNVLVDQTPETPIVNSNAPICSGNTLALSATTGTTGLVTWLWTGPNGFSSSVQNPSIPDVTTVSSGIYSVVATSIASGCSSLTGSTTVVVVSGLNSITQQPTSVTKNVSENALFVCKSSDPNAVFQWQADNGSGFSNISDGGQFLGASDDSLKVSILTTANNNNRFRCVVTSGSCSETSAIATLNINSSIEATSLTINPNPTIDIITIKAPQSLIGKSYRISDEGGKTVMTGVISSKEINISLGKLAKAAYFITVITDKKETYKIIKH